LRPDIHYISHTIPMPMRLPFRIFISSLLFPLLALGQNRTIDSLKARLGCTLADTGRVNTLNTFAWELKNVNPDSAITLSTEALLLAEKRGWGKGIGISEKELSWFNKLLGNSQSALDYAFKALAIWEKLEKDTLANKKSDILRLKAGTLGNICGIYSSQGDCPKALEYGFRALRMAEQLGYKELIMNTYGNIGVAYLNHGDCQSALEYYFKTLKVAEELGNSVGIAATLTNIGTTYEQQKNFPKALDYCFRALAMQVKSGDKNRMALTFGNIGSIYSDLDNLSETRKDFSGSDTLYRKALEYYHKALKIEEELGDKEGIAINLGNIGTLYSFHKKYKEAETVFLRALALDDSIGSLNQIDADAYSLSELYSKMEKYQLALEYFKKHAAAKDTLFSKESTKKNLRTAMQYDFDKKEAVTGAEHKSEMSKQNAVAEEKSRKQTIIIWSVIAGLMLVAVFAVFMAQRFRITQRQKKIIEKQRAEVTVQRNEAEKLREIADSRRIIAEEQRGIITQQKAEVDHQKHIIEEKHKEITDSINYAERIQRSFLATRELLDGNLKEYFVFFQPKDIVSGDFYWASLLSNGNFALATADSTGHGVPGAIMSILNISCLENAVGEMKLKEPGEIFNHTRLKIIERLKKDGSPEGGKDGMDCSLICFDFKHNKFTYAAANNPVWIVRGKEILEFAPDKMPVGKHDRDSVPFTQHTVDLQKGDVVYAITDGMPDQFGGPKGKKYLYKQLKELLISIASLPMQEQKETLASSLNNWKGNLEQVDDVCVIGIRL
jgi:serine phosphatase RsbU (regulator of sigma subunit)